ncbi:NAD(P)H-dependent oxidoreductase [Bacteroidia bacterium]|nr:NAD(P)H-dependent oxidoreductase [Bacteroidia bacterium]
MESSKILDSAIWRIAVKTFDTGRKISKTDFATLLDIARYSPSSFGLEPWKIIVVQDEKIRSKIAECATGAQRQLETASHFVVFTVTTDLEPTSDYFKHICFDIKKMNADAYSEFISKFAAFQKEKTDLTDFRKRIDWAGKQAYIVLGNMMLAASIMGIDSCPIEGFFPSLVESVLHENGIIDSKKEHIVVMGAFGYRQNDPEHSKIRRSFDEVVCFI